MFADMNVCLQLLLNLTQIMRFFDTVISLYNVTGCFYSQIPSKYIFQAFSHVKPNIIEITIISELLVKIICGDVLP